jgi:hypothetical protein
MGNIVREDVNTDGADRLLPGGPNLTNRQTSFRKISACTQERHIGEFRRRLRQAITEVEPGLVAASTKPRMRIDGGFPVVFAKGHDAYIPVGQKALKKHSRLHRQARSQDERRFDKGGGSDRQRVRLLAGRPGTGDARVSA